MIANARLRRSISGRRVEKTGRYFIRALAILLGGYALFGKPFAYIGVPPVFVGEIVLVMGLIAAMRSGCLSKVLRTETLLPLFALMIWGVIRTVPYLGTYGVVALRDAVLWGYGIFAISVAAVLISVPEHLISLIRFYRRFAIPFLVTLPFIWLFAHVLDGVLPDNPITGGPFFDYKQGDACVHVAGCFAFMVALNTGMNPWITSIMVPLNLALNIHGRGGIMAFIAAAGITSVLRPFHPRAMRIFFIIGMALIILWATEFKIENVNGREISFDFLVDSMSSIVGGKTTDPTLSGTKEWRLKWWTDIVNYTIHGRYFWDGKGFGINLAEDDGYSLDEAASIRSPHNGHLTMLARAGVPGLVLWSLVQVVWFFSIARAYWRARRRHHVNFAGLFLFLAAYWAAAIMNGSFDVYFEGPMGGIWLWTIYGVGIGGIAIYRKHPMLLEVGLAAPAKASAARPAQGFWPAPNLARSHPQNFLDPSSTPGERLVSMRRNTFR